MIPFARPSIDEAMVAAVADVLRSRWIASGPKVAAFEAALSARCGGRPVRVMTSATAALEIALEVAGVGPGDEVIVSPQTFFAAINVIVRRGARPVFVDCDLLTRHLDLDQVEQRVGPRTRALLPTHFPGAVMDLDALHDLAGECGLRVIEDAALAFGHSHRGQALGSRGDLVAFSFHPNKNLTTIEGGALVLGDADEAGRVERLRFHGIARQADGTRDVLEAGGKCNLPDVHAALGLLQLERIDGWLARRRELVQHYFRCWRAQPECVLPPPPTDAGASWNMFCVLLPLEQLRITRKQFIDAMAARGIAVGISYEAAHLTTLGRFLGGAEGQCPIAERIARETVTLPLYADLTEAEVEQVCEAAAAVLAAGAR